MRPPLFRASDRTYLVSRRDGTRGRYGLSAWTYEAAEEEEAATMDETREEGGQCVPVFCDRCFGGTSWDTRKAPTVQELTRLVLGDEGGHAGVCGVANMVESVAPGWRKPEFEGDMVIKDADDYYRHQRSAEHMFQPCGDQYGLRYGHGPRAGQVIAYWHDHRDEEAFNLCAVATVESRHAREALDKYVADPHGSIALSLGNFQLGRDEIISELSVVLVPGRVGCFGKLVRSDVDMAEMLGNLRYPTTRREPPGHRLSHLVPTGHGAHCASKAEVVEATLNMVAFHRDVLKLAKTHPGRSSTEKYINYGIGRYSQLTRRPPPKLLTASAMSALSVPDDTLNTTAAMVAGKMMMAPILDLGMNMIKELNSAAKVAKAVKKRKRRANRRRESDEEDSDSNSEESGDDSRAKRRRHRGELGREEIAFVRAEVKRREEERKRDALMTELKACLQAETAGAAPAPPPPVIAAQGLSLPTHTTMPGDHTLPALTAMVQRELRTFMDQFKKAYTMPVVDTGEQVPTIFADTAPTPAAPPPAASAPVQENETENSKVAPGEPAAPVTMTAQASAGPSGAPEVTVATFFKQLMA